jgi:hypothetical protein
MREIIDNLKETSKAVYYIILLLIWCGLLSLAFGMMSQPSTIFNTLGFLLMSVLFIYPIIVIIKKINK